jgi:hypothetical protein
VDLNLAGNTRGNGSSDSPASIFSKIEFVPSEAAFKKLRLHKHYGVIFKVKFVGEMI